MYQVWLSRGYGPEAGPRFRLLGDALRFIHTYETEGSFAVKTPDGTWYRDGRGRSIFSGRRGRWIHSHGVVGSSARWAASSS